MKKTETVAPATATAENANVNETPVVEINQQPAEIKPPTIAELEKMESDAFDAYAAIRKDPNATEVDRTAKHLVHWKIEQELKKARAAEIANKTRAELEQKLNVSKDLIASAFGVPREKLDEILSTPAADEKGVPNPLNVAIQTVFGKPITFAKPGQKGTDLTGKADKTSSDNGQPKVSGYADTMALMDAGKTYDEMIAAGQTDSRIRNAANQGKYSKQKDGTYVKKA